LEGKVKECELQDEKSKEGRKGTGRYKSGRARTVIRADQQIKNWVKV
jgi:hypothetical protein